ncbi:MAG: hypothetical protein ACI9XZ_004640, partial [Alphaproteobacteria bacterium]
MKKDMRNFGGETIAMALCDRTRQAFSDLKAMGVSAFEDDESNCIAFIIPWEDEEGGRALNFAVARSGERTVDGTKYSACPFRPDPAGDSDLIRPSIPFLSGHGFRSIRPSLWRAAGQYCW